VPRLDAAPQHDLRRRPHRRRVDAEHPRLRALVRHLSLRDPRLEPSERSALRPVRVIMRITRTFVTVALAMAPIAAHAQQPPPPVETGRPPALQPWTGTFDFGVRGTSLDGDAARYERYRDLSDGFFLDAVRVDRQRDGWLLNFMGDHVGR